MWPEVERLLPSSMCRIPADSQLGGCPSMFLSFLCFHRVAFNWEEL